MTSNNVPSGPGQIEAWLAAARQGSSEALGHLLEACRPYLLQVANDNLAADLQAKQGASDLVQETFLEAQRDFGRFSGLTEGEMLAWLRCILLNNLANLTRHYRNTGKRQVQREVDLAHLPLEEMAGPLEDQGVSPSSQERARERDEALERALAQLSEDQREAIRLRNYERLSFEEVGQRLGRSGGAARKLWSRAVEHLQRILEPPNEP
jgi:RNA polymerase sigma-70 factor (ECF subfamily)